MTLRCDNCGHHAERHHMHLVHKLDPRNLQPERRRHCQRCLTARPDWRKVDFTRSYEAASSKTGGRPW